MKIRYLFLLMIIGFTGLFSSCEGPMGPMGPSGPEGLPGVGSWDVFTKTVKEEQWVRDRANGVFYCLIEDNRLDKFTVEEGLVHVELVDGGGYYPLPLTEYFYDEGYFAETINFSYGTGWIRFTIGANDLFDEAGEDYLPVDHLFKITLLW